MRSILGSVGLASLAAASASASPLGGNQIGPGVRRVDVGGLILANLSRFHPDYGMTPAKHAQAKAERAAGKRKFTPKAELRQRRGGLLRSMGL